MGEQYHFHLSKICSRKGTTIEENPNLNSGAFEVYSKISPATLLAVVFSPGGISSRMDLTTSTSILQVAAIPLPRNTRVSPHKHNPLIRETVGTAEAWVVITGKVLIDIYDLDETLVGSWTLDPGSLATTFMGGHGLTSLQSDTLVYEFKNGPYWGPDVDKVQIQQ
jgi:hypothetical protein